MTTRQRQTRSHTRTNRSVRFNQLVELTSALSEADRDTKEKVETAEILSLLGFVGGRKNESTTTTQMTQQPTGQPASTATAPITRSIPQQQQLPLPSIQHIGVQPQVQVVAQQPRQQQQAIRPAVAKLPIKPVAVLPAAATATATATPTKTATTTTARAGARSATHGVEGEKKRKRSKTTPEQLRILMDEFQREPMPNATTRQTLAARLDMTPRSVQIWFQNMRAKVKKAHSGSAPGDEKKSSSGSTTSPSLADTESDGPAKKRQRTVTGEEDNKSDKMVIEQQPQSRRNSVTGPSPSSTPVAIPAPAQPATPQSSAALNAKPAQQQPIKIAVSPQTSAFAPANAASLAKPRSAEATQPTTTSTTGKLPLPVIQHHPHLGQPIFGVPLQYIPQSYHCDQLKRATMAALSGSVQHQMTA